MSSLKMNRYSFIRSNFNVWYTLVKRIMQNTFIIFFFYFFFWNILLLLLWSCVFSLFYNRILLKNIFILTLYKTKSNQFTRYKKYLNMHILKKISLCKKYEWIIHFDFLFFYFPFYTLLFFYWFLVIHCFGSTVVTTQLRVWNGSARFDPIILSLVFILRINSKLEQLCLAFTLKLNKF